ncbi:MAG: flagellar biosynthetic protein FliO [Zoogloeaceae bacterium]|nr:flagellar biosynthetic protein FliO [Zoogloeaceae bacterium]
MPLIFHAAGALAADAEIASPGLSGGAILQTLFGLILILALLGAFAWFLKRATGGNLVGRTGALRILGALPLGPKERIILLEVGAQCLVIGLAPGCIRTLHVFPKDDLPGIAEAAPNTPPFATWLARFAQPPKQS